MPRLRIEHIDGAKFRLKVFNEVKTRGSRDILIAMVDGLKVLAGGIGVAHPRAAVQTCIVHLVRNSLEYAGYKDRKAGAAARLSGLRGGERTRRPAGAAGFAEGPWEPGV